jgi:glycosyltransferase involved in cell wall biosynthesis
VTREETARLHRALAEAQEKLLWVDRIGVDLNAFFASRPGRAVYVVARGLRRLVRRPSRPAAPPEIAAPADGPKPTRHVGAWLPNPYAGVLDVARHGREPLAGAPAGDGPLHFAVVLPSFGRGSGGHSTLMNLFTRLEERGHSVTYWIHDFALQHRGRSAAQVRDDLRTYFRPAAGPVFTSFDDWHGADVVVATGWETVHPVLRLPGARSRAYLVQDHEPEFFATSAQRLWSEATYEEGLHVIAASAWLAGLVRDRHGATADHFDLGVDHTLYAPRAVARRDDTVIFYARDITPRRAVPLGMLALEELKRRRPDTRVVLFGEEEPIGSAFDYEHLGIATPAQLAWAYSEAAAGLSLSLTNHSLIPQEMLACGLPCVELAGGSAEAVFGAGGPVELAPAEPLALADALERLLADAALRERRHAAGMEWVRGRTWEHATDQVEAALLQLAQR